MTRVEKIIERLLRQPPEADFADVRFLLEEYGYTLRNVTGSHHVFRQPGRRNISLPVHSGKVERAFVRAVLRELKLDE